MLESDRARACFVGRSLSSRPLALSRLCTKDCAPLAQSTQQAYSRRPDQQSDPRKPYSPRPPRLVRQHPRLAIRASHLDSPTARSSASPPSVLSLSRADPDPSPPFSHARRRRPLTARRLHHRHGPGRRRRPRHPPRPRIARPPRPLDHAHARQLHPLGRRRQPRQALLRPRQAARRATRRAQEVEERRPRVAQTVGRGADRGLPRQRGPYRRRARHGQVLPRQGALPLTSPRPRAGRALADDNARRTASATARLGTPTSSLHPRTSRPSSPSPTSPPSTASSRSSPATSRARWPTSPSAP